MTPTIIGLLTLGGLFFLIFLRIPIGIALGVSGTLGYLALNGLDVTIKKLT